MSCRIMRYMCVQNCNVIAQYFLTPNVLKCVNELMVKLRWDKTKLVEV